MKKISLSLLFSLTFATFLYAQHKPVPYAAYWKKVEKHELDQLPKSAAAVVDTIYHLAKRHQNNPQLIKALLFQSKFSLIVEETAQLKIVSDFKREIAESQYPARNILESMLAKLYWQFLQQNRHRFYDRSHKEQKVDSVDFRSWDLQTLFNEIHLHFQKSLARKSAAQQTDLADYNVLLLTEEHSKDYRPTLYDLLAHNALEFYSSNETFIRQRGSGFSLQTSDSLSFREHALKIFEELTNFHQQDPDPTALAMVKLEKLRFLRTHTARTDKETRYLEGLERLKEDYAKHAVSTLIDFEIASFHNKQGNRFRAGEQETFRFEKARALEICNQAIARFPESLGAAKCASLREEIQAEELSITVEKLIPIGSPFRLLVDYQNLDTVSFSLYKISRKEQELVHQQNRYQQDSIVLGLLNRLEKVKVWHVGLRNEMDFQAHTTEIVAPPLGQGSYLLLASPGPLPREISPGDWYSYSFLQITDLALIENHTDKGNRYQVVDRVSGTPVSAARVRIERSGGAHAPSSFSSLGADRRGFFTIRKGRDYESVQARLSHKGDTAYFGSYFISNYSSAASREEKPIIKPFLFTDRSIYRPGQKVYFKGILLRIKEGKSAIVADEYVKVYLKDMNGREIYQERLQTNEFGSFSGALSLPSSGLSGRYSFQIEPDFGKESHLAKGPYTFESQRHPIAVEEYKRPKFKAEFKPITETYQLNDTLKVEGTAIAFAGSNVTGAKVVYRVHRKLQYPRWHSRSSWPSYHRSPPREITHGETTTNASGEFTISFVAIPDSGVAKENLPIFHYEVSADVTDLNGETRSASSILKVGYHSLLASIQAPDAFNKKAEGNSFTISSTNLNGEFVPASGRIKIYKLESPAQVLRRRPWEAPDYQDIPEDTFKALFPFDSYENEELIRNRKKGKKVLDLPFDTGKSNKIALGELQQWISGHYIMELESIDQWSQEVKDKHFFKLFSPQEKKVSDRQLFTIETDKAHYTPGEHVCLSIGSAAKELHVTIRIEQDQQIIQTKEVRLRNRKKKLKIPVSVQAREGLIIHYHFTYHNSFESGYLPVSISEESNALAIEIASFRDKLKPGEQQSWSFKVKGTKKDQVVAELLASMYDASLDQFKTHSWAFEPFQNRHYPYYGSNAQHSIGTTQLFERNAHRSYYRPGHIKFDQLDWFGFSFSRSSYSSRSYMQRIKMNHLISSVHPSYDGKREKGMVYGTVAGEEGDLLPGVHIRVRGSETATTTDLEGSYAIAASPGQVLEFSFVGYNSLSVKLEKGNILHVILINDITKLEEVIETAYQDEKLGVEEEVMYEEAPAEISLRGRAAGVEARNSISALEDEEEQELIEKDLAQVQARRHLQETAFFYPHLQTDQEGNVRFTFTAPEALTRWKLQLLAHDKEAASAIKVLHALTQKELMVSPNPPRFLREGDEIVFASKISNLSGEKRSGHASLQLSDAMSGKPIDEELENEIPLQAFELEANGNTSLSWTLNIPVGVQAVQYKIVAKAGDYSDGEQAVLPVLSKQMLLTESMPIWLRSNQSKIFTLDKLKNVNSESLRHHQLSLEVSSNPAWYALQALPYLMEYPYECAEQTFARYYANALASHILQANPKVKAVFDQWEASGQLSSPLMKNEELKSLIMEETPWLREAQSESEQKKRMALLVDLNKMQQEGQASIFKLEQMQMSNGGFPWFKGSRNVNRTISLHIASGFGHLKQLKVDYITQNTARMLRKLIYFLDEELLGDYKKTKKQEAAVLEAAAQRPPALFHIQYLYMRSFYPDIKPRPELQEAIDFYSRQAALNWQEFNLYQKGMIALSLYRNGDKVVAQAILESLLENSISSEEMGMYWKENKGGWRWHEAPTETQALLIEAFSEIELSAYTPEEKTQLIDHMKVWLLKNKQTRQWNTTKATTEAVYVLLLQGSDWLSVTDMVDLQLGGRDIDPSKMEDVQAEAGTGYFKTSWKGDEISPAMGELKVKKEGEGIAWGALYWQYFEDLDKISSAETPLQLRKNLFLKTRTEEGIRISEINDSTALKLGDLLVVRIELKVDRDMDFVHMKDMRASGLEPVNVLSAYKWQDGLGYYESTRDASTNFFFDRLSKGVYVFEYEVRVNMQGNFFNGITTIQSMYAPEFSSHSEGSRLVVREE